MATQHKGGHESGQQGSVKDPEHDGRLKENRESGRTKGTTPASEARAHDSGGRGSHSSGSHASSGGSETRHGSSHESGKGGASASGRGEQGGGQSGSDDLKSREYRDEKGEVHHHTRTYMEQHGGGEKK